MTVTRREYDVPAGYLQLQIHCYIEPDVEMQVVGAKNSRSIEDFPSLVKSVQCFQTIDRGGGATSSNPANTKCCVMMSTVEPVKDLHDDFVVADCVIVQTYVAVQVKSFGLYTQCVVLAAVLPCLAQKLLRHRISKNNSMRAWTLSNIVVPILEDNGSAMIHELVSAISCSYI